MDLEDLTHRVVEAQDHLTDLHAGLIARAHANAYWPYHGRSEWTGGRAGADGSPSLLAGESDAVLHYRHGAAHLQRALTALAACHAGERWTWHLRTVSDEDLPRDIPSPAHCDRMVRRAIADLGFVALALHDQDVTRVVLTQLREATTAIRIAHERFSRAAPAVRRPQVRPTRPARRGRG